MLLLLLVIIKVLVILNNLNKLVVIKLDIIINT